MTLADVDLIHNANLHQQQTLAKCQLDRLRAELQHWQYLESDYQQKLSELTDNASIIALKYCITQTQKQISDCEYWMTQWERHGKDTA